MKQNRSLFKFPREDLIDKKFRDSIKEVKKIQHKECSFANTALFLLSRHLKKLEDNINLQEGDGLLAPLEDEVENGAEVSRENSVPNIVNEKKKRIISSDASIGRPTVKRKKHQRSSSIHKNND